MMLTVQCKCGKQFRVDESMAGDTVHCLSCSQPCVVPRPAPPKPVTSVTAARYDPDQPLEVLPAVAASPIRDYLYWGLVAAFLPLAISLGQPEPESFPRRALETIRALPPDQQEHAEAILQDLEDGYEWDIDKLFRLLPEQRLAGAAYSRFSSIHWLFALATVMVFALFLTSCFSHETVPLAHLFGIGLFTGTIGIAILLIVHLTPIGIFIAELHFQAEEDQASFWVVLGAYTIGVGLPEEAAKAIAILVYLKGRPAIGWRECCLCGLATGIGFGVTEGIMYSADFYNGISSLLIYLVRFASCVSLHAIWSASAAVTLFHSQELFHIMQAEGARERIESEDVADAVIEQLGSILARYGMVVMRMVAVVMVLHGLYDAALVCEQNLLALLTALISFAWLAWQIEECRRAEPADAPAAASSTG